MPETIDAIVGRFDRFPDRYYEMRLERVTKQLESAPDNLEAYDDAGVACDRLGRGDEAIAWMERKKAALDRIKGESTQAQEHRYRYLANVGTFWVHRWLRNGADRARLDEVRVSRGFIADAIKLNPDAHFGREKYQLKILDWIIDPPEISPQLLATTSPSTQPAPTQPATNEFHFNNENFYPDCIGLFSATIEAMKRDFTVPDVAALDRLMFQRDDNGALKIIGYDDAERGLVGLIVLGNAWESVDVYYALAVVLQAQGKSSVAALAMMRCEELVTAGRGSLHPEAPRGDAFLKVLNVMNPMVVTKPDGFYKSARLVAQSRNEAWGRYIAQRLEAGQHPDTDPRFWKDWREPARPELPNSSRSSSDRVSEIVTAIALFLAGIAAGLSVYQRRRKRQRSMDAVS